MTPTYTYITCNLPFLDLLSNTTLLNAEPSDNRKEKKKKKKRKRGKGISGHCLYYSMNEVYRINLLKYTFEIH